MLKRVSTLIVTASFLVTLPLWTPGNTAYGQSSVSTQSQAPTSSTKAEDPHAGHQQTTQKPKGQEQQTVKTDDGGHESHQHQDPQKQ